MNGIVKRDNNDASYGTSINNIYKMLSFKEPDGEFARILEKKNWDQYNSNIITVKKGSMFTMTDPSGANKLAFFEVTQDIDLDIATAEGTDGYCRDATIDSGVYNVQGLDYYVYLVWDPTLNSNAGGPRFVISKLPVTPKLNSSDPFSIYRQIGGFHVGTVRKTNSRFTDRNKGRVGGIPINSSGVEFGTGWESNVAHKQIIHNSVWDLGFRPKVRPVVKLNDGSDAVTTGFGFVYTRAGIWESIYNIGDAGKAKGVAGSSIVNRDGSAVSSNSKFLKSSGPTPVSAYGMVPLTGTEGTSHVVAVQLAHQMGECRLLSYDEWIQGAFGSPQATASGNDNAWANASARHTTGCAVNQSGVFTDSADNVRYAVSADNVTQCVGNIWEYLSDINFDYLSTGETVGGTVSSWGWSGKTSVTEGDFYGNVRTGLASGRWTYSTHCGGFTFIGTNSVLYVHGSHGVRLASETE